MEVLKRKIKIQSQPKDVMRGLGPRIHAFVATCAMKTSMAGSSPAMTQNEFGRKQLS
tara:strand:+ start:1146 stop:1316 length:171 start_codon:yes stop_codon:yes gene_type:complete